MRLLRSQTEERKAYMRAYYEAHAERLRSQAREDYQKHPERYKTQSKNWRKGNRGRYNELTRARVAVNRVAHNARKCTDNLRRRQSDPEKYRTKDREYAFNRYHGDVNFRVRKILRARIISALDGRSKSTRTMLLLGCSIEEFRQYIEARWLPGMTWENHGKGPEKWEIDHIKPCSSFDLLDPGQQHACFNFSNCRPLWGVDNRRKTNKIL